MTPSNEQYRAARRMLEYYANGSYMAMAFGNGISDITVYMSLPIHQRPIPVTSDILAMINTIQEQQQIFIYHVIVTPVPNDESHKIYSFLYYESNSDLWRDTERIFRNNNQAMAYIYDSRYPTLHIMGTITFRIDDYLNFVRIA